MAGKTVIIPGADGVQLVKGPLQQGPNEATKLQNAEFVLDRTDGGLGALTMRGGLAALTSAINGGATVYGMKFVPGKTTIVRAMYASLGTASGKWLRSTDGATWTPTSVPERAAPDSAAYHTVGSITHVGARRAARIANHLIYGNNNYTSDLSTPANNTGPKLAIYDGTTYTEMLTIPAGARATTQHYAFALTDVLVANGVVYLAVHDPANTGGSIKGRVLSFDLVTGALRQVCEAFTAVAPDVSGGGPTCLHWFQGQLWVGLDDGDTTNGVGHIARCYPEIDTEWTMDVSNLQGYPMSLMDYKGDLYAALRGTTSQDAAVFKRTSSSGAWASSDTITTAALDYASALIVYEEELYATYYSDGGTDVCVIRKFNGSAWSEARDVAANEGGGAAFHPGQPCVFGGALYIPFRATGVGNSDGFILKNASGTWSEALADANLNGRLVEVLEKS